QDRHAAVADAQVVEQVVGLDGGALAAAIAVRDRERVGDHRQPGRLRASQIGGGGGGLVVVALGGLYRGGLDARPRHPPPVDGGVARVLERGDVHALQRTGDGRLADV